MNGPEDYFKTIDDACSALRGKELEDRLLDIVELCRKEYGDEDLVYGAVLSELGGYYRGQGRYPESEQCFLHVVEIFERSGDSSSGNYATAVNNLAGTCRVMGKWQKAEELFSRCLDLYAATAGTNSLLYAGGLNNLSLLCMDRGEPDSAEKYLLDAMRILSELPEARYELAATLSNLASLEYMLGKTDGGAEKLDTALSMYENELGTDMPHYHAALYLRGLIEESAGHPGQAEEWLEKAKHASLDLYGPEHPETVQIISSLNRVKELRIT